MKMLDLTKQRFCYMWRIPLINKSHVRHCEEIVPVSLVLLPKKLCLYKSNNKIKFCVVTATKLFKSVFLLFVFK